MATRLPASQRTREELRAALVALLEEGFERLREAGELIAEHLRSLRGATRTDAPVSDSPPQRPAAEERTEPSLSSPTPR